METETSLITGLPLRKQSDTVMLEKANGVIWPSLVDEPVEKFDADGGAFELYIPFVKADSDEHIVYGIVYEPDTEDSQGDSATAEEIKKACYQFMEDNVGFKLMHKGPKIKTKVLENYIAPDDLVINGHEVKKGSWVMAVRVLDEKIWKMIKNGTLTGFSMAGYAATEAA